MYMININIGIKSTLELAHEKYKNTISENLGADSFYHRDD
jgi:hypothetical protein